MAEPESPLDADMTKYLGIVRAALDPDPRKFNEAYLGQAEPGFMDYVLNQNRFGRAAETRDAIVRTALTHAFNQAQEPRIGDVLKLRPDFPIPDNAYKQVDNPIGPVPVAGLDRMARTEDGPLRPLHGPGLPIELPGPGAPRPEPYYAGFPNIARLVSEQKTGRGMVEGPRPTIEGPRPHEYAEAGVYEPETVPMVERTKVFDPSARLPTAFQMHLKALEHREGLREYGKAGAAPSAPMQEYQDALRLGAAAFVEKHGRAPNAAESLEIQREARKYYASQAQPGTPEGNTAKATSDIKGAEAAVAPERQAAELKKIGADTRKTTADANESETLLNAKLQKLQAEIAKIGFDMSQGQRKAAMHELANNLGIGKALFHYLMKLTAMDNIDAQTQLVLAKAAIEKTAPYLEVDEQPSTGIMGDIKSFFGADPQMRIRAKDPAAGVPGVVPPVITPPPGAGPSATAPTNEEADKAAAFAQFKEMKEGETRTINGKRLTKKGSKLVPAK